MCVYVSAAKGHSGIQTATSYKKWLNGLMENLVGLSVSACLFVYKDVSYPNTGQHHYYLHAVLQPVLSAKIISETLIVCDDGTVGVTCLAGRDSRWSL